MPDETRGENEICISGVGIAACLGLDAETIWRRVRAGECGIGPMPAIETALPEGKDGGQAPDLPIDYRPNLPREARYLRWTIDAALRDASIDLAPIEPSRVWLLLGTTLHGMRAGGEFLRTGDHTKLNAFLAGDTARLASEGLAIGGLSATTCSACSSSLGAIAMAVTVLERGQADIVIAGGYDAVSEYAYAGFGSLRLISDAPLRPFAKGRTGMKVAEGYGVVVLERRADAERRAARPRAIIAGWGESADAHHLTRPHPEGEGALAAMRQAVDRAGIRPANLGLIAAHATGTPDNDSSEAAAMTTFLGEASRTVPVVGFKSHLGHTLGGAGAVELVLAAMSMRDGIVPPTASGGESEYDALLVNRGAIERRLEFTLNTSLGFGGANTCVVLRAPDSSPSPGTPGEGRGDGLRATSDLNEDPHPNPLPGYRERGPDRERGSSVEVVISGIGVLLPSTIGNDAFRTMVDERRSLDRFAIEDSEFESLIPNARRLRRMSTYVKLSICAATLAARDAKLLDAPDLLRPTGAILGTMHGSAGYCYDYYAQIVREGMTAANPVLFAEGVPNAAAAQLSLTLGLAGACQTILGTRTSGLDALALASMRIAAGEADRIIVCASEESHPVLDAAYSSSENRAARKSMSVAVALVIERRDHAERRGAQARAIVGSSSFARRTDGESLASANRRAFLAMPPETVRQRHRIVSSPIALGDADAFSVQPLLGLANLILQPPMARSSCILWASDGRQISMLEVSI